MIQREAEWWIESLTLESATREFDIRFWQAQPPSAIFEAAWELVVLASKIKGNDPDELRLQRSAVVVKPIRRLMLVPGSVVDYLQMDL